MAAAHDVVKPSKANDSIDADILDEARIKAGILRQRAGVEDTPALVAAEHYLVARGLLRKVVDSPMATHLCMLVGVPVWEVVKTNFPKPLKEFPDKPGSPRWMWVRAWGYYKSQQ